MKRSKISFLDIDTIEPSIEELARKFSVGDRTVSADLRSTITPSPPTSGERRLEQLKRDLQSGEERFMFLDVLGEGGMGRVFLAEQRGLGRKVAVKALRPEANQPHHVEKLLQEAWITGSLEHPNIVPVHDIEIDRDGIPRVALKRIEGQHWGTYLHDALHAQRRLKVNDLLEWNLRILIQVCQAVHFAHARGFIHRDLKPENVMIGEFGEVYVADWGLALALKPDPRGRWPDIETTTDIAGTPAYMAPEMLAGSSHRLGPHTDIYLLGGILYEILTGDVPHRGDSFREVCASILSSPPALPEGAPAELAAICSRAMALDPAERHQSADEFREDLEGFLRHRGSRQIAYRAERTLDRLATLLRSGRSDTPEGVAEAYSLYTQCHYGFREAIRSWDGNTRARAGLERAVAMMVDWELARGAIDGAAGILASLSDPPETLRRKVEIASLEAHRRREQIDALRKEHDPSRGRRTRLFFAVGYGVLWTLTHVGIHFLGSDSMETHYAALGVTGVFLLLVATTGLLVEDRLKTNHLNRTLALIVPFTLVATVVFWFAGSLLGLSPETVQIANVFIWFIVTGGLVITTEKRFWPTALMMLAAFFFSAYFPHLRHLAIAAANLALTLNAIYLWRLPSDGGAPQRVR